MVLLLRDVVNMQRPDEETLGDQGDVPGDVCLLPELCPTCHQNMDQNKQVLDLRVEMNTLNEKIRMLERDKRQRQERELLGQLPLRGPDLLLLHRGAQP